MNMHVIPNHLIKALVAGFYAYAIVTSMPLADIVAHTVIGLVALGVGICIFVAGIHQAGTLKLLATAFLWFGVELGLLFTTISMGMAYIVMTIRRFLTGRNDYAFLPFAIATAALFIVVAVNSAGDVPMPVPVQ